jgi:hypothetical protein
MNKVAILSIAFIASITLAAPNVYAEEGGFFDWLMNLFGGFDDNESVTSEIETEDAGYEVDLVVTDDITVDFYKELPTMDYEFIVLRSHSLAIYGDKPSSWIFTGEKYDSGRYTQEQLYGILSPGVPFRQGQISHMTQGDAKGERLFMLGSKMIDEMMTGQFPGTHIILGGCDTLSHGFLAEALVKRGASSVVGWNGLVELSDNDAVMLSLLDAIFNENLEMDDAVEKVMTDYEGKTYYGTKIKHFSSGASGPI